LLLLAVALCGALNSCTTLVNRRDLYSPDPAPDSLEAARDWYGATSLCATGTIQARSEPVNELVIAPIPLNHSRTIGTAAGARRWTKTQPKGRFAFTRATSVASTRAAFPRRRLRFARLEESKWRLPECARSTLPPAVILKRLATDLRVLLRAIGFGISLRT